jgi:hypothetical protein
MGKDCLSEFTSKIRAKNRICFGDVQRLQRNILADGIGNRAAAELLIDLDRQVSRADPAWERWLVTMMVDFVVWAERPTGIVDEDAAGWLVGALTGNESGRPTKTGRLIIREIAREAQAFENEALAMLASVSKPRARQTAPDMEPAVLAA